MQSTQGFSLIELLVVVTIIAILSAIAIPTYNRYIIKAHIIELLTVADTYKVKLIENSLDAAYDKNTVYNMNTNLIEQISIHILNKQPMKHIIQVVAKMQQPGQAGIGLAQPNASNPLTLQLQGVSIGEVTSWSCHVAPEYNDYVPSNCKNNMLEQI
jgi:prepilin-type N-terminal cleavage/methylation domain-containing protein